MTGATGRGVQEDAEYYVRIEAAAWPTRSLPDRIDRAVTIALRNGIFGRYLPREPSSAMADGCNAATKCVVTYRPESLEWGSVEVRELFCQPDPTKESERGL